MNLLGPVLLAVVRVLRHRLERQFRDDVEIEVFEELERDHHRVDPEHDGREHESHGRDRRGKLVYVSIVRQTPREIPLTADTYNGSGQT